MTVTLILCPKKLDQEIIDKITSVSNDIKLVATDDEEQIAELWPKMDILFNARPNAEELTRAKNLKWIQVAYAGVDSFMFDEFIDSEIKLTNVRGMHGQTISEHVLMMMLVISNNLFTAYENQKVKLWNRYERDLISAKKLVVVGLGGIGKHLAKLASNIGMEVIGVDLKDPKLPYLEDFYQTENMKEALKLADFIVIATPLTEETYHFISTDEFDAMNDNATFINIARGKVVDQEALYLALVNKKIKNAAIDVFEREPLETDSPLWQLDNIIITPHIAGTMPEYMESATDIFVENLKLYLADKPLNNLVDKKLQF